MERPDLGLHRFLRHISADTCLRLITCMLSQTLLTLTFCQQRMRLTQVDFRHESLRVASYLSMLAHLCPCCFLRTFTSHFRIKYVGLPKYAGWYEPNLYSLANFVFSRSLQPTIFLKTNCTVEERSY